jgi:hypothetical protein
MNQRDAPLDEIPDWTQRLAALDGPSWMTPATTEAKA